MSSPLALWGRVAALCGATVCVLACGLAFTGPPAHAHPFGPPPTALVSADGRRVVVEWGAAPDDAMVVGMAIGVLDDGSLERYLEGPVQIAPPASKEEELSASDALRGYLLERIAVTQGGRPCEGIVEPIDNFMSDGARVVHQCPEPVTVVDLRIAMLHDVHESYRTFAITEGKGRPAQSAFTSARPEQRWDFAATADGSPRRRPLLAGLAGVAGVVGVGVVAAALRRRSSEAA
ncbi:MAG TPA: hypothetical protein VM287_12575 [Egibacteraceae bacterium]|nr:hypothetical protein [Egibacteraceae bacterium]